MMKQALTNYFQTKTKTASLAVFRILFGFLMMASIFRFWYHGWIESLYLKPQFHFHFFEFVSMPSAELLYALFIICAISSLGIALGCFYRISSILFFCCFTYIELLDKTTYLNHYYFVSLVSFLLIFLPAHHSFSFDAWRKKELRHAWIYRWQLDVLKLMIAIVYIYAGLAKLNADWLLYAMPMKIWLPSKVHLPLLGPLLAHPWTAYLFSWTGAIYDLSIVFLLCWKRTRILAFVSVVIFHLMTAFLFQIGMFPYIMITCSLLFFSPTFHERLLVRLGKLFSIPSVLIENKNSLKISCSRWYSWSRPLLFTFFIFQFLLPARFLLYDGNLFWNENGYRFSWRVMLMEKSGWAEFEIFDAKSGDRFVVRNEDFLTPLQQKQMATQTDFILQYARLLEKHFSADGHENLEVYVDSYVALNGRPSQAFIDPELNLLSVKQARIPSEFIIPLHD